MNQFLNGIARAVSETFDLPEPILEIGSYQVAGQEDLANLRGMFPSKEYVGIDMRSGPGVDWVADVEELPFENASFGTVIALSTFEHVKHFWKGFEEIHRVLKPNGAVVLSTPFYFHIHDYPSDYWRLTPQAMKVMLEPYPAKIIGWQGPKKRPANVWAVAFGEEYPPLLDQQLQTLRARLKRYAKQPLTWTDTCRYYLARCICGSRPMAPFLQQGRWGFVYHTRYSRQQLAAANAAMPTDESEQEHDKVV